MLEFKQLELGDKSVTEQYTDGFSVKSSELCFTTFYIWRRLLNVQYAVVNGNVVYKTRHGENPMSLRFPLGNGDKASTISALVDNFKGDTRFYGLTDDMLGFFDDRFEISEMTDYADYLYESEKLITLSGKKLHGKRNHINTFNKLYTGEFSPLTPADEPLISNGNWYKDTTDEYLTEEKISISELVRHFDELGLMGEKLTVGGKLAAFTIGERLNDDTAVVHIEKADTSFKGAYTVINQHFAQNYLSDFKYINREEDMGLEGLKKAKMSYHPTDMIKKYKAVLKG